MTTSLFRCAYKVGAVCILLTGCGGSQPPIDAPGAMPPSRPTRRRAGRKARARRAPVHYVYATNDGSADVSAFAINGRLVP